MAKQKSLGAKIVIVVFFGAFLGFGLTSLYIAGEGAWYGYQSKQWPVVEGVIDESRIKTGHRKKGRKRKILSVNYHYQVDGQYYVNDKAQYLDNMFYPKSKKQEIVTRFKKGQQAEIYYNPENPAQSVLITGSAFWAALGGIVLGLLFSVIGLFGLTLLRK